MFSRIFRYFTKNDREKWWQRRNLPKTKIVSSVADRTNFNMDTGQGVIICMDYQICKIFVELCFFCHLMCNRKWHFPILHCAIACSARSDDSKPHGVTHCLLLNNPSHTHFINESTVNECGCGIFVEIKMKIKWNHPLKRETELIYEMKMMKCWHVSTRCANNTKSNFDSISMHNQS